MANYTPCPECGEPWFSCTCFESMRHGRPNNGRPPKWLRRVVPLCALIAAGAWHAITSSALAQAAQEANVAPESREPAQEPLGTSLTWQWREFNAWNYTLMGTSTAVTVAKELVPLTGPARRGGMFFDDNVRGVLRVRSADGSRLIRSTTDVLLAFNLSYPLIVDIVMVVGWYRDSPEVAAELALIYLETVAFASALEQAADVLMRRERPFGQRCGENLPEQFSDCASDNRYNSFYSGHTAIAFTSASVQCINHAYLPIYGDGSEGLAACLVGMGLATATGLGRVMSDRHYLSDVVVGAGMGMLVGFGLPWLLHYRHRREVSDAPEQSLLLLPTGLDSRGVGLQLLGTL